MSTHHLEPFNVAPKEPRGKLTWPVVAFRIHPDELAAMDRVVKAQGSNRSVYSRAVIVRALLADLGDQPAAA